MSDTTDNSTAPEQQPAAAPSPVGIPNVARENNQGVNKRGLIAIAAVVALGGSVAGVAYWKISSYLNGLAEQRAEERATKPASATGGVRKMDEELPQLAAAPASAPGQQAPKKEYQVPDVRPQDDDAIRVRTDQRTAGAGANTGAKPKRDPRDAPLLLAPSKGRSGSTATATAPGTGAGVAGDDLSQARDQIRQAREQLNVITGSMQRMSTTQAQPGAMVPAVLPSAGAGMPGASGMVRAPGMPPRPQAQAADDDAPRERAPLVAGQIADMSLTLAEGDGFTCTLAVEVVSNVKGRMKCITQADVRGADQQVVLAEKGTLLTGEYSLTNVRAGTRAIEAYWTRLRTPYGVTVPLKWNAVGPLGASGIDGYVNNRWGERITAALLLALIDDAVKIVIADKQQGSGGDTNIVFGGTAQTGSRMAEKVLDSTINIPPTISRNHGTVVGVDVMNDVDFSKVYQLRPGR
ncbi:TrbI/VirB10 family protein [Azohydromonas aeria]|uniref:TrbI/VirB10 family protein n=1 Tax=Azohydromonas aeria TaxID=2590212 RepID=UPI0012FB64C5|nr:TrbI/VirB10 family protein [Azohydromonas aeria]